MSVDKLTALRLLYALALSIQVLTQDRCVTKMKKSVALVGTPL